MKTINQVKKKTEKGENFKIKEDGSKSFIITK